MGHVYDLRKNKSWLNILRQLRHFEEIKWSPFGIIFTFTTLRESFGSGAAIPFSHFKLWETFHTLFEWGSNENTFSCK